jgi:hypothetical protein
MKENSTRRQLFLSLAKAKEDTRFEIKRYPLKLSPGESP